jgi:hypothetical protein
MRAAIIAMCLLGMAAASRADRGSFFTGNDLSQMCEPTIGAECIGYVAGVLDGAERLAGFLKRPGDPCPPSGVKGSQVVDVVKKQLRDHPEYRRWAAGDLVLSAISEAFHCSW